MGFGDSVSIGSWKIVCQSYTQDSNANYDTDYALLDLYHGSKLVTRLSPERRVYFPETDHAQASTVVAIHSTLARDLYVVFEGRNQQSDKPTIKIFLNPLVNWIWIGVGIVIFGTAIALAPSLKPSGNRPAGGLPAQTRSARSERSVREQHAVAVARTRTEAGHA